MLLDLLKPKENFSSLGFTSDCHCHLLPGVDDGAKTLEQSVAALQQMRSMGISSAVLTPHMNPEIFPENNSESIRKRFSEFIHQLPDDIKSGMSISLGGEYMVVPDFEKGDFSKLIQFLPGKVLIEMSYLYQSKNMEQTLFELYMAGIKPVIAHPERYLYLADTLNVFERFYDMGAEFQLNLLSLSGTYGPASMRILNYILDHGMYSYMATDAHSAEHLKFIANSPILKTIVRKCSGIAKPISQ